jgi:hypothetical protein
VQLQAPFDNHKADKGGKQRHEMDEELRARIRNMNALTCSVASRCVRVPEAHGNLVTRARVNCACAFAPSTSFGQLRVSFWCAASTACRFKTCAMHPHRHTPCMLAVPGAVLCCAVLCGGRAATPSSRCRGVRRTDCCTCGAHGADSWSLKGWC